MIEELDEYLSVFEDQWEGYLEEKPSALSLEKEDVTSEDCFKLLDEMEELAEYFDPGRIIFQVEGENDGYRIQYNPVSGTIHSERIRGEEYDIDQLYSSQAVLADALERIEENTVTTGEEIREVFEEIHDTGDLQVDAKCAIQKSNIEDAISEEIGTSQTLVHFHFDWEIFANLIRGTSLSRIRDELLDEDHSKSLIIILSLDDYVYGDAFGVSGLSELRSINFSEMSAQWLEHLEDIRRQTIIQEPDQLFLPPSFFQLEGSSDKGFGAEVQQLFARYTAFFSLLSIVNTAEKEDETTWHIRIRGRQFIEGDIETDSTNSFVVRFDGQEKEIEITEDLVDDLYSLFSWTYTDDVENRITVVRNVATLQARDLYEIIINAGKIRGSAESNRRYYIKESVDEFFEFRQDLAESAFQTRREFSNLRSELMNDLSRDIFRTFGFIIAIAASAVFRLDDILPPVPMYNAVAVLIFGYGIVTFRRVRGIRAQFVDLLENQSDYVDFYSNFFDEEELEELGLEPDDTCPWWCGAFQWWWQNNEKGASDPVGVRCAFALDLWIYYIMILVLWVLSVGMAVEAMEFIDLVHQIP